MNSSRRRKIQRLPLRVEKSLVLEHFGNDWNGRIHWVGNDEDERLWTRLGNAFRQTPYDTGVDLFRLIMRAIFHM